MSVKAITISGDFTPKKRPSEPYYATVSTKQGLKIKLTKTVARRIGLWQFAVVYYEPQKNKLTISPRIAPDDDTIQLQKISGVRYENDFNRLLINAKPIFDGIGAEYPPSGKYVCRVTDNGKKPFATVCFDEKLNS